MLTLAPFESALSYVRPAASWVGSTVSKYTPNRVANAAAWTTSTLSRYTRATVDKVSQVWAVKASAPPAAAIPVPSVNAPTTIVVLPSPAQSADDSNSIKDLELPPVEQSDTDEEYSETALLLKPTNSSISLAPFDGRTTAEKMKDTLAKAGPVAAKIVFAPLYYLGIGFFALYLLGKSQAEKTAFDHERMTSLATLGLIGPKPKTPVAPLPIVIEAPVTPVQITTDLIQPEEDTAGPAPEPESSTTPVATESVPYLNIPEGCEARFEEVFHGLATKGALELNSLQSKYEELGALNEKALEAFPTLAYLVSHKDRLADITILKQAGWSAPIRKKIYSTFTNKFSERLAATKGEGLADFAVHLKMDPSDLQARFETCAKKGNFKDFIDYVIDKSNS